MFFSFIHDWLHIRWYYCFVFCHSVQEQIGNRWFCVFPRSYLSSLWNVYLCLCATRCALCIAPRRTLGTTSSLSVHSWLHYHIPRSAVYEFQSHSYFLSLKTVSQHGVHTRTRMRWVASCSSYHCSHSLGRSNQPKTQCYHNPKQNISPIFTAFGQLMVKGKNGKFTFGTTHVPTFEFSRNFFKNNYKNVSLNLWIVSQIFKKFLKFFRNLTSVSKVFHDFWFGVSTSFLQNISYFRFFFFYLRSFAPNHLRVYRYLCII